MGPGLIAAGFQTRHPHGGVQARARVGNGMARPRVTRVHGHARARLTRGLLARESMCYNRWRSGCVLGLGGGLNWDILYQFG